MSKSKVSILINNYNYGRYLGDSIESALSQTYPNVEVVVVDDGSTDDSRRVIESFGKRITVILQANGGQTSALNAGLAASTGEWIFLLDSDDLFLPHKVERILELAAQYPTAGLIAHDLQYCNELGTTTSFGKSYVAREMLVDDRKLARRGSLSVSLPATSGLCIMRDTLTKLMPMPNEIRIGTDNYIKWIILSLVPVLVTPELLARQRIHSMNHYTTIVEGGGTEARVRLAMQSAIITYQMSRLHPHLKKLAWKQYGRLLYGLRASSSPQSSAIEADIRRRFSVVENDPVCLFYVGAAFSKAYVEDLLFRS